MGLHGDQVLVKYCFSALMCKYSFFCKMAKASRLRLISLMYIPQFVLKSGLMQ